MVLLIDGYNILKQITDARFISQQERESFISKLEVYAHRKRHHITLVFDGGEFFKPAYFKISPLMTIVYSGEDRKADDVLKQLVAKQYADNTLLVTSDYEICKYA
jgi:predicted RNA-binding protein with PIN domain